MADTGQTSFEPYWRLKRTVKTSTKHVTCEAVNQIYFFDTAEIESTHIFGNKTANINIKNCSLSIMLLATDHKPQKS